MTRSFPPGMLLERLDEVSRRALEDGALEPIATRSVMVEDAGVRFLVRVLERIERKHMAQAFQTDEGRDPFLPYEEALFVADVSETHVAILNKYNVLDRHLLIATRAFEEQESLLTVADFEALWTVLRELEGLFFYNAGPEGGASQRHKHLQLVPVPLSGGPERCPMEPLYTGTPGGPPFPAHVTRLEDLVPRPIEETGRETHERYLEALAAVGRPRNPRAYNLLGTRDWMVLVPRRQSSFREIAVNALGFAGAMLVPDDEGLRSLFELGPMRVLTEVSG